MEKEKTTLSEQDMVKAYVEDPKNKDLHIKIAIFLSKAFKNQWFRVVDINRKTAIKSSEEASRIVTGLLLFNLCFSEERDGVLYYRIVLTKQDRLRVLEEYREKQLKQIKNTEQEIEKIKSEIEIEK